MGITREIESITIDFEEPYQLYGESVIKEVVGNVKNDRKYLKLKFHLQFLFMRISWNGIC